MVKRNELVSFLDDYLRPESVCNDSSNNGLQVEGRADVERIIFSVDASMQLFQAALAGSADFLVVHHGISWRDNLRFITGMHAQRLQLLFDRRASLYASHLPLDAHPVVGNNAVIAGKLSIPEAAAFFPYGGLDIGRHGTLPAAMPVQQLTSLVNDCLNTESTLLAAGPENVSSVGIVSGGGADALETCSKLGIDCLVTGEVGHVHYHTALELGVNVIAAGHYRTEVCGPAALMAHVAAELDVACAFADLPTGY